MVGAAVVLLAAKLNIDHQIGAERRAIQTDAIRSLKACVDELFDISLYVMRPIEAALTEEGLKRYKDEIDARNADVETFLRAPTGISEIMSKLPWHHGVAMQAFYSQARRSANSVLDPASRSSNQDRALVLRAVFAARWDDADAIAAAAHKLGIAEIN